MESNNLRKHRAKLNIVFSLLRQFVVLICGLIVPRLLLATFGSEAYGATTSIANFLSYITLLEGGIGGVARAALYKPLAEDDTRTVSIIVAEIKRFFRVIGYVYLAYVIVLAFSYKFIADVQVFDYASTVLLVLAISISTFAQYFIGISYSILLQAAQRSYDADIVNIITTILNTILIVILVFAGSNLILVKFISSCVFVLRPVCMWLIVKKDFDLDYKIKSDQVYLTQKWDGLAQHIAYFLNSNTDIAVLTIFYSLTSVSVYSVYNMVVAQIKSFASSFSTGMEALFGDMIARNEQEELHRAFDYYDMLISYVSTIVFSVTLVMIVPFVEIYTRGIDDANYIDPLFALMLTLSCIVASLMTPYHNITIAAGHFRQTQVAAYGEAIINLALSIGLVRKFGLVGVAIGTLVAAVFRFTYYVFYLRTHIFNRPTRKCVKREVINGSLIVAVYLIGEAIVSRWNFSGYMAWIICAIIVTTLAIILITGINTVFYKEFMQKVMRRLKSRHFS